MSKVYDIIVIGAGVIDHRARAQFLRRLLKPQVRTTLRAVELAY